jgi:hypothetical protein
MSKVQYRVTGRRELMAMGMRRLLSHLVISISIEVSWILCVLLLNWDDGKFNVGTSWKEESIIEGGVKEHLALVAHCGIVSTYLIRMVMSILRLGGCNRCDSFIKLSSFLIFTKVVFFHPSSASTAASTSALNSSWYSGLAHRSYKHSTRAMVVV